MPASPKAVCTRTSHSVRMSCLSQGDGALCGAWRGVVSGDGGLCAMVVAVRPVVQDEVLRGGHRGAGGGRLEAADQGTSELAGPTARNLHARGGGTDASAHGYPHGEPPTDAGQLDAPGIHRTLWCGDAEAGHQPTAVHQDGGVSEEASARGSSSSATY